MGVHEYFMCQFKVTKCYSEKYNRVNDFPLPDVGPNFGPFPNSKTLQGPFFPHNSTQFSLQINCTKT